MRAYLLCAVAVLLGSVSAACGGGSGSDDPDSGDDTGGQTGSGGNAADGGSQGSGGDTATGGSAGESLAPAELFPLAVGNTWTYEVVEKTVGACVSAPSEEVVETVMIDEVTAFHLTSACFETVPGDYSTLAQNGTEIVQQLGGGWETTLGSPLVDGHSWVVTTGLTFLWVEVGQVTVPAGTFEDCWQRPITPSGDYTETTTFCRGVGPVIRENDYWRLELTEFELN